MTLCARGRGIYLKLIKHAWSFFVWFMLIFNPVIFLRFSNMFCFRCLYRIQSLTLHLKGISSRETWYNFYIEVAGSCFKGWPGTNQYVVCLAENVGKSRKTFIHGIPHSLKHVLIYDYTMFARTIGSKRMQIIYSTIKYLWTIIHSHGIRNVEYFKWETN